MRAPRPRKRDAGLFVTFVKRIDHQLSIPLLSSAQSTLHQRRLDRIIRIHEKQVVTARSGHPGIARTGYARPLLTQNHKPFIMRRHTSQNVGRFIRGPIIDTDDFDVATCLAKRRCKTSLQVSCTVIDWNHNACRDAVQRSLSSLACTIIRRRLYQLEPHAHEGMKSGVQRSRPLDTRQCPIPKESFDSLSGTGHCSDARRTSSAPTFKRQLQA